MNAPGFIILVCFYICLKFSVIKNFREGGICAPQPPNCSDPTPGPWHLWSNKGIRTEPALLSPVSHMPNDDFCPGLTRKAMGAERARQSQPCSECPPIRALGFWKLGKEGQGGSEGRGPLSRGQARDQGLK